MTDHSTAAALRPQLAAELSENARYRLLVESITDYAIYMLDVDGYVTSWNPGALRCKGYTAAEIIGQHFSRFYTDRDQQAGVPKTTLETAAREGRFEGEGWRMRKDGSEFWVSAVVDPIYGDEGRLIGFAKITRDLTKRHLRDQEHEIAQGVLRQSEEQFKLLVQGVSDYAIYFLDPAGIITNWNVGAERIKGYTPEEIIGCHFSRFYSREDVANGEPDKALETALRDGRFEEEGWRYRKDGSKFWADVLIDPIRDPGGALLGFAKVTRDMTKGRQEQAHLDSARAATAQTQKLEAIGQLTGGVAHDFNNLLMAILGSLELIGKRLPGDEKLRLLLNNAFESARRGVTLTQRMLSFARRRELALRSVDLATLMIGMSDMLERSLGPHVTVQMALAPDLPPVKADPNQLETAVLNLALNARDAMPHGGKITIGGRRDKCTEHMRCREENEGCVVLFVTDTGEGMDEATLARAMEPFFTTKGVGTGTGLGLSMAHGLAEQLGGRLLIHSRPGQGTTVELWLPLGDGVQSVTPGFADATIAETQTKPLTIVVVDDDPLVLLNNKAMLEDLGHRVMAANSGAEALALIRQADGVDLLVTDQAMPQMTGIQLIAAVRAEWPKTHILLVSGYAELPNEQADVAKLAKPFSLEDLERVIARFAAGNLVDKSQTEKFGSSYRD